MNKQKWLLLVVMAALLAATAGLLGHLERNQKLGEPGIKATPIPGRVVMKINLPARAAGFTSTNEPESKVVLDMLPKDTSYAQRRYFTQDGFWVNANVILMGTDRTSIHKPQFCLPGQGWTIDHKSIVNIPIGGEHPYQLPVAKWVMHNKLPLKNGQKVRVAGLYVFWFVARDEETTSNWKRMWWLARDLLTTGVLQRWAYVSYFTAFEPGQEDVAFKRVRKLIAASVPHFQLPPETAVAGARH